MCSSVEKGINSMWMVVTSAAVVIALTFSTLTSNEVRVLNARIENQQDVIECVVDMVNQHEPDIRQLQDQIDAFVSFQREEE